jgi:hypothetical protein
MFSSTDHYIVCSPLLIIILSVLLCWSLYCLFSSTDHYIDCSPLLIIILSVLTTDNRMTKRDEQIMTNRGEHTTEWTTEDNRQQNDLQRRTDNIMTNRGILLYVLLCWSLSVHLSWSFYCLLSSVGHYIVCSPLLVIILAVLLCRSFYCLLNRMTSRGEQKYNDQQRRTENRMTNRGEQTIEWPTEEIRQYNDQQRTTDNRMTKRGEQIMTNRGEHTIGHSIVCSPLLIFILSVLLCCSFYCMFSSVGHSIFCSPLLIILLYVLHCWSFYCLFSSVDLYIVCSPLLVIILSVPLCWSLYCQRRTENIMTNRGEQTI